MYYRFLMDWFRCAISFELMAPSRMGCWLMRKKEVRSRFRSSRVGEGLALTSLEWAGALAVWLLSIL